MTLAVTTIIPTYNRAGLISRAVSSVLRESRPEDEVIVVDDGSTDDTRGVLAPLMKRIRFVAIENSGAGHARNVGISMATRPLVAFLDSDDEWLPGKLELQRRLMTKRSDLLFCFTDFCLKRADGSIERRGISSWPGVHRPWSEITYESAPFSAFASLPAGFDDFSVNFVDLYLPMMSGLYVAAWTAVVRREQAGDALHFDEDMPTFEDWACFARLARLGKSAYLATDTAQQNSHRGSRLTDADRLTVADTRLQLLQRVWGSDPAFLRNHGAEYKVAVCEQRLDRTRALLADGRSREARRELALLRAAPLTYRALAQLPGPLLRTLVKARRALRRRLHATDGGEGEPK